MRHLPHLPPAAVWRVEEETLLRWFPVLRRAGSLRGEPAVAPITGNNATRGRVGTLTPRTGHRLGRRCPHRRQESVPAFLRRLRPSYPGRAIWLLLEEAPCPLAPQSPALAETLQSVWVWLPKQCSERHAMAHLWRAWKEKSSANSQCKSIDEHADFAENWLRSLSSHETLLNAGVLAQNFAPDSKRREHEDITEEENLLHRMTRASPWPKRCIRIRR